MASKITVEKKGVLEFIVRVSDAGSEFIHHVTVKQSELDRLAGEKIEAEKLIERSFEFLLEREPKESILARFDLSVIGRYFPEYEREMKRRFK